MNRKKPLGRTLKDFHPLWPAELQLLEACKKGEIAEVGHAVPDLANNGQRVRAEFVRFLLLGGDQNAPVHERGVQLHGAFVEGQLDLMGCRIAVNVSLMRCHFDSEIRAHDARLDGVLNLNGSHLDKGLTADRLRCMASVFLRFGFKATGRVSLVGAQIGGDLSCNDGQFEVANGNALAADRAAVNGDVILGPRFKAKGEVRLVGAHIGGNLRCSGGQFEVSAGIALNINRMSAKGDVIFGVGFKATGEVRVVGAQIGGELNCGGGHFEVKHGFALNANGADVKGDVILGRGFKVSGNVRLIGGEIGGDLVCSGGQFEVKNGDALNADRVIIKGSVFLRDAFKTTGTFRLLGAQIGGDLSCTGGQFDMQVGTTALSLDAAAVQGVFFLFNYPQSSVRVAASHAKVAVLVDDVAVWAPGSILDGFSYGTFGGKSATSGTERLKWLSMQPKPHRGDDGAADFRPQPWRQLQRVLRDMGHTEDAKQVGIAFEDRLRSIGRLGLSPPETPVVFAWLKRVVTRSAHVIFGKLTGYGYRPIRLVAWMTMVWFLCGVAYWWMALPPRSAMAPSDPLVFQNKAYDECLPDHRDKPGNWYLCGPLRGEYATFSPFAFSLDVMLPVVDLGQEKTWGAFVPTPKESPLNELFFHRHWGHWARLLTWFETLFGWLSSLLLVAIVSGYARRNDEG